MNTRKLFFLIGTLVLYASPNLVWAKLRVVTTLPSFADIARIVGGDDVNVTSLTKGTQDPHFVDAKPDLILQLNKADLVVKAGLGLEEGWLPSLVVGSRNVRIQSGSSGDLDVSTLIHLREVPRGAVDRSQGDVHPGGNPHFMADPRNGIAVASGLAERFSKLLPEQATGFKKRAEEYSSLLNKKVQEWQTELKPISGKPVVTYHKSWLYFSNWVGLNEVGYVEPKPGIPPSPDHIVNLVALMKAKNAKLILMEPFYPKDGAEEVARMAGAKLLVLPVEVNGSPDTKTYIDVFDKIVKSIKSPQ